MAQIPISTIEDLQKIGNDPAYPLNGNYILVNDIEASATKNWNDGKGFNPIGNRQNEFTGIFDGCNRTILNLMINRPDASFVGLFSSCNNSTINNIILCNVYIIGKSSVGAIAGIGSNHRNCHVSGYISGETVVGGIVGERGLLINCSTSGTVNAESNVGGLTGADSWIENSFSNCNVTGDIYVGGLAGNLGFGIYLKNSYSAGEITGIKNVGGLVGMNIGAIVNCFSTSAVVGDCPYIGGLVGINHAFIQNCYVSGPVSGFEDVGGIAGYSMVKPSGIMYRIIDAFFDKSTTGQYNEFWLYNEKGIPKSTIEMMALVTFTNWDFENVWWMIPGKTYPLLRPVRYVGLNIKPEQSFGLPAEFKIIFDEPVRNFTFDDVDISLSTVGGILGTLTPDDAPTTITAMDCFTTWTLRLEDAASTTGLIVMRLPVAAAMNAANYPTTESVTLILPLIEPLFGDLNADGVINTLDRDILIALILDPKSLWHSRLLLPSAADINKDGVINVADIISLITYLK